MDSNAKPVKEKLLLHVCCAPCATHVIELLVQQFQVCAFFYNPNIWPEEEYKKRLSTQEKLCVLKNIELIYGDYEHEHWLEQIKGFKDESEGGRRCEICYAVRLRATARAAVQQSMQFFATTLSISPHKNAAIINRVGHAAGQKQGVKFLTEDFKKKDGYRKSCELSKGYGLYRQNYCGCEFSKR